MLAVSGRSATTCPTVVCASHDATDTSGVVDAPRSASARGCVVVAHPASIAAALMHVTETSESMFMIRSSFPVPAALHERTLSVLAQPIADAHPSHMALMR